MVKISKDLYEITHLEITARLSELTSFISQTKSFSLKCNNHIKMMAHLVNTMIESPDFLELTDRELRPSVTQSSKRIEQSRPSSMINPDSEQKLVDQLIANFQNENDRLWDFVQKGEHNTEFIKGYFDKLFETISQRDKGSIANDSPHHQENVNNINTYPFMMDPSHRTNVSVHLPDNHVASPHICKTDRQRSHRNSNRFYSVYDIKNDKHEEPNEGFTDEATIRSLKDELTRVTKELKLMRKKKDFNQDGLKDMLQELIDVKHDSRDTAKPKDRGTDGLFAQLMDVSNKVSVLSNELAMLKEEKKLLEQNIAELLSTRRKENQIHDDENSQSKKEAKRLLEDLGDENKELKKRIWKLEKDLVESEQKSDPNERLRIQNDTLQNRIRELEDKAADLDKKNGQLYSIIENKLSSTQATKTTSLTSDDYDFLKCVYAQGCYLEDFFGHQPEWSIFNHHV